MPTKKELEAMGINADSNIIICENCYQENESTRTTCMKCGSKLYNNENEKHIDTKKSTSKNTQNYQDEEVHTYKRTNKVAIIIKIIAIVGAVIGIIAGCIMTDDYYTKTLGITYIIVSVISAVFVYALGEIIQLLEDIKNK